MKNMKFDKAVDEIIDLVIVAKETQMDQLRASIKMAYDANISEIDPNEIAQQIMNLPVNSELGFSHKIEPARLAIHLDNEMMCTAEKNITIGEVGDLRDLSYVKVGSDIPFGKEFYHHCPEVQDNLVRLHSDTQKRVHVCPVCGQKYEQK